MITKSGLAAVILFLLLFNFAGSFKGVWQYAGGVYNGKAEAASAEYSLQRRYDAKHYEAFLLEKGEKAEKYEAGEYVLNKDTCLETQTFSAQESKVIGISIRYLYTVRNDTLIFDGTLPNGASVHEFWKKIK